MNRQDSKSRCPARANIRLMSETESKSDLLARAHALPKVLLHEHLDGGLRVGTLLELLRERGLTPPAPDARSLARLV
jgi:hypothetical protein